MRWMFSRYLPLAVLLVVLAACQSPFSTVTPSSEAGAGTGCAGEAMICPGRPAADGFALVAEGVAAAVLTEAGDAASVFRTADVPDSCPGPPASHRIDRQGPGSPVYPPFGE